MAGPQPAVARRILQRFRAKATGMRRSRWQSGRVGPAGSVACLDADCLLDCAHNVEGLTATGKALKALGRPLRLVYAAVADKDVAEALSCLPDTVANHWCAADVPRAMPVEELERLPNRRAGPSSHASVKTL